MFNRYSLFRLIYASCLVVLSSLFSTSQAQDNMVVDIIKPVISTHSKILKLSGSLSAEKYSMLSPRVDGLIAKVNVDAGSHVKKGDVLLQLDPTMSQYQLKQIKANVIRVMADRNEADRIVKEAEGLIARKTIPQNELAIRKANLELKKAELLSVRASQAIIEETLRRHDLIAPFSGVISNKMSEMGEWVSRGDSVLELVNLDEVRLDIKVPQEHFAEMTKGAVVTVISDAYPKQRLKGHIHAVVPVSDSQVRAFLVRITFDNKTLSLLPGTSATAEFTMPLANNHQLLIPRDALLINPDGSHSVFIIENDKAFRRKVELGRILPAGVNIISGINIDDWVVVRGNEVLHHQQSVTVNYIDGIR
ncbi:MAG: efflux transporter periplasmic adaptor subunit [Gammaproteobacteria bacterium]|nr:MAG: efflux transporter periplasmic adaptor subunit [Gammaproteobacteria bacterium]